MKKLVNLCLIMLLSSIFLNSCQIDSMDDNPQQLQESLFLNGTDVQNFLNASNSNLGEKHFINSNDGIAIKAIAILDSNSTKKESFLIYSKDGIVVENPFVIEQIKTENSITFSVFSFPEVQLINRRTFKTIDRNDSQQSGLYYQSSSATCADSTDGFTDCVNCAMEELSDEFWEIIGCGLNPWSCLAAAIIHCI